MGQEIRGVSEAASLTGEVDTSAIGSYLARQRRLRDISLEDLSARTKIPRRSLERLESGAFDSAADGFTRGFVRTVATALGLDANDAVARLLAEPPDDEDAAEGRRRLLQRALALATAVALAAGALFLLVWGVRSLEPAPDAGETGHTLLYRRDAVRELAESRASEPAPALARLPDASQPREKPAPSTSMSQD